jgi:voltage-gated potassium channel
MEIALTPFFLGDFLYRLYRAKSKRRYVFRQFGWADLLSAVPLLRFFASSHRARGEGNPAPGSGSGLAELAESRAVATFALTIFLVFVVLEASGASIFAVEGDNPAANIRTPGDALWWGIVTITTVGYGDQYPVTSVAG